MIILYVYFVEKEVTSPNQEMWMKVGWERYNHNILSF
jgi:hypothetical protein